MSHWPGLGHRPVLKGDKVTVIALGQSGFNPELELHPWGVGTGQNENSVNQEEDGNGIG